MTVQLVVSGLLVLIAAVAVFYVARASKDIAHSRKRQDAIDKQAKAILTKLARGEATFARVTANHYEYQKKILDDPKVQAILNRHES